MGFTIFPKSQLPKHLTVDIYQINVAKTSGFSLSILVHVAKLMFFNISKHNVAQTSRFTIFLKRMLLKPLVLQYFLKIECCQTCWFYKGEHIVAETIVFTTFSNKQLLKHLTAVSFKINVIETHLFTNTMFVNVVKPIGL